MEDSGQRRRRKRSNRRREDVIGERKKEREGDKGSYISERGERGGECPAE